MKVHLGWYAFTHLKTLPEIESSKENQNQQRSPRKREV